MKLDVSQRLKTLRGEDIVGDHGPLTFGEAAAEALIRSPGGSPDGSRTGWKLAQRLMSPVDPENFSLSTEEAVLIKESVAMQYNRMVAGQVVDIIESVGDKDGDDKVDLAPLAEGRPTS